MNLDKIIEEITIDDMPSDDMRYLAEQIGVETVSKMLNIVPGCTFYIPMDGFRRLYSRKILSEYDGTTISIKKLAIKYNTTEGNIREILKSNRINLPSEGQIGIFDEAEV